MLRCHNCGVCSTPQWRRGPSGLKTLCNRRAPAPAACPRSATLPVARLPGRAAAFHAALILTAAPAPACRCGVRYAKGQPLENVETRAEPTAGAGAHRGGGDEGGAARGP